MSKNTLWTFGAVLATCLLVAAGCSDDAVPQSTCSNNADCPLKARPICHVASGLCVAMEAGVPDAGPSDASDAGDLQAKDLGPDLPDQYVHDQDTRKEKGDSCTSGAECKTGKCIDDVCCDTAGATCGDCKRCNVANNLGDCVQQDTAAEDCVVSGQPSVCSGSCSASGCVWPTDVCQTACAGSPATQLIETMCNQGSCDDAKPAAACTPAHTLCLPTGGATGGACAKGCTKHADCAGTNPLCDRTNAHAHPDGLGLCVDPANVVPIATKAELTTYIASPGGKWGKIKPLGGGAKYDGNYTINAAVKLAADGAVEFRPGSNGSVFSVNTGGSLTLQGLTLTDATGGAAGVAILCQGPLAPPKPPLTIVETTVLGSSGVGINASNCSLTLRRSTISTNTAGGLSLANGTFELTNNLIRNNGQFGISTIGGVFFGSNAAVTFEHNTVVFNQTKATETSGVHCSSGSTQLMHSIVADNSSTNANPACQVSTSDTTNGACGVTNGSNYKPTVQACFDKHLPPVALKLDRANTPRVLGAGADLGCYEVQ